MNRIAHLAPQIIPLSAMCGLVLAGVAISLLSLWRAQTLFRGAPRTRVDKEPADAVAIEVLRQELQALQQQVQESRYYTPPAVTPPAPRSGLNLDKRSQALRLHRRGESPAHIAAMLELPLQEVDLLIKVHRIVLRSI
jgi:hypothetical protein